MASVCISNCVNDACVPVRASYVKRYKWPESDAEFLRSNSRNNNSYKDSNNSLHALYGHPRVVDSISCRQIYLRSYKFSRKETVPEKTQKCFGKVKQKVGSNNSSNGGRNHRSKRRRKCLVLRKMKEISCLALFRIFHRFLSCAATVDVLD